MLAHLPFTMGWLCGYAVYSTGNPEVQAKTEPAQSQAAKTKSLVAPGLEGPLKSVIGRPDRDDPAIVKGALSQYRSDLGFLPLADQKNLLSKENVSNYVDLAKKYKTQLNKTKNEIADFKEGKSGKSLMQLMEDYSYLVKSSDPNYCCLLYTSDAADD